MTLVKKTNHVAEALTRPIEKFKNQPVFLGILESFIEQIQDLENSSFELIDERTIDTAVGAQLDGIGSIVGEDRLDRSDDDYRTAIRIRILRNLSNGTASEILEIMDLFHSGTYEIIEDHPAAFRLVLREALLPTDPDPLTLAQLLADIRSAAVDSRFIYNGHAYGSKFKFASGDSLETSSVYGFGNDAQSTGGYWVDEANKDGIGELTILKTVAGLLIRAVSGTYLIAR